MYTIKKLAVTKMGGRSPVTGRKVIEAVGGGSKQRARWIDWLRCVLHQSDPADRAVQTAGRLAEGRGGAGGAGAADLLRPNAGRSDLHDGLYRQAALAGPDCSAS